jgi:hypothetical protein
VSAEVSDKFCPQSLTNLARFFLCPETGGKTLEQVDYLFGHGARAWKNVDFHNAEESWDGKPSTILANEIKQDY